MADSRDDSVAVDEGVVSDVTTGEASRAAVFVEAKKLASMSEREDVGDLKS